MGDPPVLSTPDGAFLQRGRSTLAEVGRSRLYIPVSPGLGALSADRCARQRRIARATRFQCLRLRGQRQTAVTATFAAPGRAKMARLLGISIVGSAICLSAAAGLLYKLGSVMLTVRQTKKDHQRLRPVLRFASASSHAQISGKHFEHIKDTNSHRGLLKMVNRRTC